MKKILLLTLSVLLAGVWIQNGHAQIKETSITLEKDAPHKGKIMPNKQQKKDKLNSDWTNTEKSLLWRVSGNGLSTPSYLFGTIHIICKEDFFWTEAMDRSLKECKRLCYELNITDPTLQMKVAMGMMNRDGTPLKELLGEDYYEKLKTYTAENIKSVPFNALEMLKPMAISTTLSTSTLKCKEQTGYEMEIKEMVDEEVAKNILGLESAEDQIAVFNSVPEEVLIENIKKFLDDGGQKDAEELFGKMLQVYKSQDLEGMSKLMDSDENDYLDQEVFLKERNRNWIEKMRKMMEEYPTFFAVGAAHLAGEEGVINLLRKAGYTVEPVLN